MSISYSSDFSINVILLELFLIYSKLFIFEIMKGYGNTQHDTYTLTTVDIDLDTLSPFHLIVWNDEVNTFKWVIETLMEVCNHTTEQAEQCAYLIHFRGKYTVKEGNYDLLKPMCNSITQRGINATIESLVR